MMKKRKNICLGVGIILLYLTISISLAGAESATVSWDPNTESDLNGYKIYFGTQSKNYSDVIDVGKITSYKINNLQAGVTYYFAVTAYDLAGNESGFSQEVNAFINPATTNNPPEVLAVVPKGETQIDVVFSKPLEQISAENSSNYSINNGVQILGAILDTDETTVHLLTTKHETGGSYTLSVSNIKDKDGNAMQGSSTKSYNLTNPAQDSKPPELLYIAVIDETHLEVIFNEAVNKNTAENSSNYSINNGVQVTGALLKSNQFSVQLTTSTHQANMNYTLTVSNVQDLAGNTVQSNNSFTYRLESSNSGNDDTTAPELIYVVTVDETHLDVIFNEMIKKSQAENMNNFSINNNVQVTAVNLDANQSIVHLTTTTHQSGTTYTITANNIEDLAGNRIQNKNSFSYKFDSANNNDNIPPQILSVAAKGETQIDVNFAEPVEKSSAENRSNYSINNNIAVLGAVRDANLITVHLITSTHQNGVEYTLTVNNVEDFSGNKIASNSSSKYFYNSDAGNDNQENPGDNVPSTFSLYQNYPNPFNPETEIRFYLSESRKIELKIYNPLGQLVKTLVSDEISAGEHTLVWNGTDDSGTQMPSGVYIYSLEVSRNVRKGDLLVNVALERRVKRMTLIR